jgi:hypothetical protein
VKGLTVAQRCRAPAVVPAFSGVAEYVTRTPYDALLRLDKPGPGVAALGAVNFGGPSMVALNLYHYRDQAAGTVAHVSCRGDFSSTLRCLGGEHGRISS